MTRRLDPDEIASALTALPGWAGDGEALHRSYAFPMFLDGVRAVTDVAEAAEALDHHPDIDIRWRTVVFGLSTHSAGGVTQLDVELAHRIDEVAREHGGG